MNYGGAGAAMLPVTGIGIAVAGHNIVLGTMIAVAVGMVTAGCALYRASSWKRRINAAE